MNKQTTRSNQSVLLRFIKATFMAALPALVLMFSIQVSQAGSATWNLNPASDLWSTASNWTPATVPNGPADTATFDISNTTALSISAQTEVNGIVFNVGASAYTLTTPFLGLTISGVGINNMSGMTQNITNGVPFNPDADLFFTNNATAGNLVTVNTVGGSCDGGPAHATFFDAASAGSATFINNGNTTCSEANGATTSFFGSSTAANGTLINYPNFGASGLGGTTYFNDTSMAGNAILIAYTGDGAPGRIFFYGDSTGGTSRVEVSGSDIGWGAAELNICSHNAPGVTIGSIEGEGQVSLGGNNLTVGRNNHSTIFSGFIGDSGYFCGTGGSLTKIGRGTLILTGANTYTGGTTIEEGQLLVDNTTGSGLGSGSVQVNAGRLGGNGTIAGAVTVGTGTGAGATLAPGERCDELGVITILGTLTFNSDARYNCGLKNRQHVDKIIANGVTINGGKFVFDANSSSALRRGTVLTVIDNTAATPIVGTFDNLADGSIFAIGNTYQVSYEGNDGNDLTLTVVLAAFAVTTTDPACNNIINTLPNDFVVNLSEAAGPGTVQAGDFTVNGLPADSFVLSNGNATITFHFNSSPVVTQGVQTMHIPAGAFNRASDNQGVFDFTCTFRYDALQLQVVSTNPPVGGTFSPPAPNNYQYDVNFNEAVDAASVQTSDLTVSGTGVPSVTGVSVISGNMTARFTLHMNFGGSLSASIAAGAIADQFGNPGAAFSGSYTVAGCPPQDHYDIGQIGGGIEPGTTDIGNHCEGCVTTIALPFPYTLYDQTYSSITLSSSGNAQFTTLDAASRNLCLPWTAHNYTILPFWDHLYTGAGGFGIFTSVTGTAPNRIFNIEWRADYVIGTGTANFELRLYEDQNRFDVIYGSVTRGNTSATAGVQKNDSTFDQYFCNGSGGVATGGQSYTQPCTP